MRLFFRREVAITAVAAAMVLVQTSAQSPTNTNPDQSRTKSEAGQAKKPSGKVLFERSLDGSGKTVSTTGAEAKAGAKTADAPVATDEERLATAVTGLDLDVRLISEAQQIAVRGLVTVRNAGNVPLKRIPLQISSSLKWERIRAAGRDSTYSVATLNSDSDHTAQLHEAAVELVEPLAPGATMQMDVLYSGKIEATARRLISVGTPEDSAAHSDWDVIGAGFTGLRGFGNVVWYPVSSIPVILGDGARLFDEIGRQKQRAEGSQFRLKLTVEFPHGQPPTLAAVNGHPLKLDVADTKAVAADVAGVATGDTGETKLSFESPSLFVATEAAHAGSHMTVYASAENEVAAKSWLAAGRSVSPMIERWLGEQALTELTVIDLPDPDDAPWESGPLLAIPVRDGTSDQLEPVLSHAMTHAWMSEQPYWLNEGAANFMGTIWDDRQHRREHALATLEDGRGALALVEPPSPGEAQGQPLAKATSPVYYRTKAAWVLWMLREMVGDDALSAGLRASNAAGARGEADAGRAFENALVSAAKGRDIKWLFADWIDADHGLPDLSVGKVFPNAVQAGNWLVSLTISNAGYAAAEVPVTVRSATNVTTERVLVPAHGSVTPRLVVQGKPTEVQVNDGTVPETQATVHVMHLDDTADAKPVNPEP
ncbi:MAG: hypothetical protein JST28_12805 [Acidobacteria bacterium]|nr:hypothetical protein [Acidobacteriota bacterium]